MSNNIDTYQTRLFLFPYTQIYTYINFCKVEYMKIFLKLS